MKDGKQLMVSINNWSTITHINCRNTIYSSWPTGICYRRSSSQQQDLNPCQVASIFLNILAGYFFSLYVDYVTGDGEGGNEMTGSMQLIREFCDHIVSPEKATRTRIVSCVYEQFFAVCLRSYSASFVSRFVSQLMIFVFLVSLTLNCHRNLFFSSFLKQTK